MARWPNLTVVALAVAGPLSVNSRSLAVESAFFASSVKLTLESVGTLDLEELADLLPSLVGTALSLAAVLVAADSGVVEAAGAASLALVEMVASELAADSLPVAIEVCCVSLIASLEPVEDT
ncbi:hypothetical protein FC98_GL002289 [Lentilactobacillus kisonensis DSM 19906 = JCM 15041]|uniref:Uncharacterized protein n=1 Tax=Lentilactobacillus kisonensis DSM 19906 = JCM 15041 TaxID=1423766 RepID=A0A0R1NFK7_9LACO|nr:hypothetical protein FC98_GL002289 [Lentilactobacillus kisonensis DSM 19906 = JCM 15041]